MTCITSSNPATTPKWYQKLRFFGATYLPHCDSQVAVSGKRASIKFSSLCMPSRKRRYYLEGLAT